MYARGVARSRRQRPDADSQRELPFAASPRARGTWHSVELPDARVFGGDTVERIPLTPALVDAFRRAYLAAVTDVRNAGDYRAALRASDTLATLARAYGAYLRGLRVGLDAAGVAPQTASAIVARVSLAPGAFSPPIEERSLPAWQRDAFQAFARRRGEWERASSPRAQVAFADLATLAASRPVTLYIDRTERVVIEGVSVGVQPMAERTAARALDVLAEALRLLRAQRRVPWLLARMPPLALTVQCVSEGVRVEGGYDERARTVLLCASLAAEASPREVARTVAHETGHSVWRTSLSGAAQAAWEGFRKRGLWISEYAKKNAEEAFCEALGLLAAYGSRAVGAEVAAWLQTIVPTVRTYANGRRAMKRRSRG